MYEWRIEGVGSYIGKYKHISRPKNHYTRNINNLRDGKGYRKSKPDGFRRIHRELAEARRDGRKIDLIILENPGNGNNDEVNRRERELINERGNLNGGSIKRIGKLNYLARS